MHIVFHKSLFKKKSACKRKDDKNNILTGPRLKYKARQSMSTIKAFILLLSCFLLNLKVLSQERTADSSCEQPATIILFRTFSIFHFKFSYNLYSGDSLLGRIKTHDVIMLETFDSGISFHATTQAPSLNANKLTKYLKRKTVKYSFSLQQGQVYFVECDFRNQSLFDFPRQPTIRLLKKNEVGKYLSKRFLKRKIKSYLYKDWLEEKSLKQYATKK